MARAVTPERPLLAPVQTRLSPAELHAVEQFAEREERPISHAVRRLVRIGLRSQGLLDPPVPASGLQEDQTG